MTSLMEDISKRILDPAAIIKEAEDRAENIMTLVQEESSKNANAVTINDDDPLEKKADLLISAIDDHINSDGDKGDKSDKDDKTADEKTDKKDDKPTEKKAIEDESDKEKSPMAKYWKCPSLMKKWPANLIQ